jgi:hypothetical protein
MANIITKIEQGTEAAAVAVWHEILKTDHIVETVVIPALKNAGAEAAQIEQLALALGGAKAQAVAMLIFGPNGILAKVLMGIADADNAVTGAVGATSAQVLVDVTSFVSEIKALI